MDGKMVLYQQRQEHRQRQGAMKYGFPTRISASPTPLKTSLVHWVMSEQNPNFQRAMPSSSTHIGHT